MQNKTMLESHFHLSNWHVDQLFLAQCSWGYEDSHILRYDTGQSENWYNLERNQFGNICQSKLTNVHTLTQQFYF